MSCLAADGWLPEAEGQLATWLREKYIDVDITGEVVHESRNYQLRVQHHHEPRSHTMRARLIEVDAATGMWTTELVAHDRRGDGDWISLTVENDQRRFVKIPRIARYLMRVLPLGDGSLEFVDSPQLFRETDVARLVALLRDQQRHGLVFVAGTSHAGLPFEAFKAKLGQWSRQVYGLGQVIVLDPRATELFNATVGASHKAPAWTIRTYYPGVDLECAIDGRRHRILGHERLGRMEDQRIELLLGEIARNHASTRVLPNGIVRTIRKLDRLQDSALLAAIEPAISLADSPAVTASPSAGILAEPTTVRRIDENASQLDLVKSILGITQVNESALRRIADQIGKPHVDRSALDFARKRIEEQQCRVEELEDGLREMQYALEDDQLERAQIYDDLSRASAEIRWLREMLRERGDFDIAFGIVPGEILEEIRYPESFETLLEWLQTLGTGRVRFTGDRDKAIGIDEQDTLESAVRTAWDACRALDGYLRARDAKLCSRGVDHYLRNTPENYPTVSSAKHAATETRATMNSYGDERRFPVPCTVNPTGSAVMKAHFKLARIGIISPRMYYLDDYAGSRAIYIGYIGPHLTNTQTN